MKEKRNKKKNVRLAPKKSRISFSVLIKGVKVFFISILVISTVTVSLYYGSKSFAHFLSRPIASVTIKGEFFYLEKDAMEQVVSSHIQGSFMRESLSEIQSQIEASPWVDSVSLRRQWPDVLIISINEQTPIARWGDVGFVNNRGELINTDQSEAIESLPVLRGNEQQTKSIMKQYQVLSQAFSPYGLKMVELANTELGVWNLILDNGWQMLLGRHDIVKKVQNFMHLLETNKIQRQEEISVVDMRYENGLAIKWLELEKHVKQQNNNDLHIKKQNI